MRESFEDYLFSQRILACGEPRHSLEVLASLASLFGICVTEGAELLEPHAIAICARNLGEIVPEPFYQGFPASVKMLATYDLALNQLLHYLSTYGLGDFSETGHAYVEHSLERVALEEHTRVLSFRAVTTDEAEKMIVDQVRLLLASTRPISDMQLTLIVDALSDFDLGDFTCASRDTASRLVCHTWDESLYRLIGLPDVLRVVEWLIWNTRQTHDLKRLHLNARERRHITRLLDYLFEHGVRDARACLERRRLWRGLLHHLHYKPKNETAQAFVDMVFGTDERSVSSAFEALLAAGDTVGAARLLVRDKGHNALARNLNYLLSRARDDEEADEVISLLSGANKIVLIQLALMYERHQNGVRTGPGRIFRFTHLGLERVHRETYAEVVRRRSKISPELSARAARGVLDCLEAACANTLGRVYIDPAMERIALPLRSSVTQSGIGSLPAGSRVPIEGLGPEGCVRAFLWWKNVDDIDLSCFGIGSDTVYEFSWRTMASIQEGNDAIVYSGDETSGFKGGSEYFDVSLPRMRALYPSVRYVVVCANVYSGTPFSACTCRAGYMLRKRPESGEVYEPSTVESALAVTSKSTYVQLFALDLERFELVWLNIALAGAIRVAGTTDHTYLLDILGMCDTFNLANFARMLASEVVGTPEEADVVVTDEALRLRSDQERIGSVDTARVMALMEG